MDIKWNSPFSLHRYNSMENIASLCPKFNSFGVKEISTHSSLPY